MTELNYITAVQRHIDGRLGVNDYYLNDSLDVAKAAKKTVFVEISQHLKNQDTPGRNQGLKKTGHRTCQDLKIQDTEDQDTVKQDEKNRTPQIRTQI